MEPAAYGDIGGKSAYHTGRSRMRLIFAAFISVNYSASFGPAVMRKGKLPGVGVATSPFVPMLENAPAVVMQPIC